MVETPIPVRGGERSAERFLNLCLDFNEVSFRHITEFAGVIYNCWVFLDALSLRSGKKEKVLPDILSNIRQSKDTDIRNLKSIGYLQKICV